MLAGSACSALIVTGTRTPWSHAVRPREIGPEWFFQTCVVADSHPYTLVAGIGPEDENDCVLEADVDHRLECVKAAKGRDRSRLAVVEDLLDLLGGCQPDVSKIVSQSLRKSARSTREVAGRIVSTYAPRVLTRTDLATPCPGICSCAASRDADEAGQCKKLSKQTRRFRK